MPTLLHNPSHQHAKEALALPFLQCYSADVQNQARLLLEHNEMRSFLQARYPTSHNIRGDKALFEHAQAIKNTHMRHSDVLNKVQFDSKLQVVQHALGTHTTVSRVQGKQLKSKREIKIATLFKVAPIEWLDMILVHELAHIQQKEHDKSFYKLCTHMLPSYHTFELHVRLYLTHQANGGGALWTT